MTPSISLCLVSFSGKKKAGKSFAAKILEQQGFTRLSLAGPLKKVCAGLAGMSLERLELVKDERFVVPLKTSKVHVSRELGIDVTGFDFPEFTSIRHMLQYIGTDVIRKVDAGWHVRRFEESLKNFTSIVVDDVRFRNELECIKKWGGTSVYIDTLELDVESHISESSIFKEDTDFVIVNDRSLEFIEEAKSFAGPRTT